MFCVQEAYDRNCHTPCHAAETTTADNAEKKWYWNCSQAPIYNTHTPRIHSNVFESKGFYKKNYVLVASKF